MLKEKFRNRIYVVGKLKNSSICNMSGFPICLPSINQITIKSSIENFSSRLCIVLYFRISFMSSLHKIKFFSLIDCYVPWTSERTKKNFTCKHCKYSTCKSSNFKTHMLRHLGQKPYHCPICGKQYTTKFELHRHSLTHLNINF